MLVPTLLFLGSAVAALVSVYVWGPVLGGPLLLSGICAVAALILLVLARPKAKPVYIVVDGSNVMHWDRDTPSLATVGHVIGVLEGHGFTPVVWFDANVGYLVSDRYMGPDRLARHIGVTASHVFVAPKGTPADPLLLEGAGQLQARVVTNDRFRDWADDHPVVREPGFLVGGRIVDGSLTLGFSVKETGQGGQSAPRQSS